MATRAALSMCDFHLTQSKFCSVFVTVAEVSGNITGWDLLRFFCFVFFLEVYNFTVKRIFVIFYKWFLQASSQEI